MVGVGKSNMSLVHLSIMEAECYRPHGIPQVIR